MAKRRKKRRISGVPVETFCNPEEIQVYINSRVDNALHALNEHTVNCLLSSLKDDVYSFFNSRRKSRQALSNLEDHLITCQAAYSLSIMDFTSLKALNNNSREFSRYFESIIFSDVVAEVSKKVANYDNPWYRLDDSSLYACMQECCEQLNSIIGYRRDFGCTARRYIEELKVLYIILEQRFVRRVCQDYVDDLSGFHPTYKFETISGLVNVHFVDTE